MRGPVILPRPLLTRRLNMAAKSTTYEQTRYVSRISSFKDSYQIFTFWGYFSRFFRDLETFLEYSHVGNICWSSQLDENSLVVKNYLFPLLSSFSKFTKVQVAKIIVVRRGHFEKVIPKIGPVVTILYKYSFTLNTIHFFFFIPRRNRQS